MPVQDADRERRDAEDGIEIVLARVPEAAPEDLARHEVQTLDAVPADRVKGKERMLFLEGPLEDPWERRSPELETLEDSEQVPAAEDLELSEPAAIA